jgi:hypothetical protein
MQERRRRRALEDAIRMSHSSASANTPPTARPLTAATSGGSLSATARKSRSLVSTRR